MCSEESVCYKLFFFKSFINSTNSSVSVLVVFISHLLTVSWHFSFGLMQLKCL